MFYEESVIDGVLHFKTTPEGEWRPITAATLTAMFISCRDACKAMATVSGGADGG
jgi:hypothetical protein